MDISLSSEIRKIWSNSPSSYAHSIDSILHTGYTGWAIRDGESYSVAIEVPEKKDISERFAGARLSSRSMHIEGDKIRNVLTLSCENADAVIPFSFLCAEFVTPGDEGINRRELIDDPVKWWLQWKELVGNRNVDDRVYDTLGELVTLKYLAQHGIPAHWDGPSGSTYDIDCEDYYVEVKSTIARNKKEITLSDIFQLAPPDGHALYIMLCQFEPAIKGLSIDSVIDELAKIGYSKKTLDILTQGKGLEKGCSARKRNYIIHAMTKYTVDEKFPAIRESDFVGGSKPLHVKGITYTVSLDGIQGEQIQLTAGNENDLQDN